MIRTFAEQLGYFGLFLLMLVQDVLPILPSEMVLATAGFGASAGKLNLVLAILACTAGSMAGMLFWFVIGRQIGVTRLKRWTSRHGRWITLSPRDIERVQEWFGRHGRWAIILGRATPTVGVLIAIPAGLAGMPLRQFLIYAAMVDSVYSAAIVGAAYYLGDKQWHQVEAIFEPAAIFVLVAVVVIYVYRVATFRRPVSS